MMELKIVDVLNSKFLAEAKLVAGAKGLDKNVTSVTVGEVPDIAEWLHGGEIVLSTLFSAGDNLESQLDFVGRLIKSKAAALLVKPERFIGKLDPKIISLADKKGFPLVVIPPELRWTEIVSHIYHLIIGQQMALLERSSKIHRELLAIVINGGGFESIAKTASDLVKGPVILENVDGEVLADSKLNKKELEIINKFKEIENNDLGSEIDRFIRMRLTKRKFPAKVRIPIVVDQETKGYVCTFETTERLNDLDLIALEHAATVTAVEMGKKQAELETEMRLKGDFIDDLIAREFQSKGALLNRAKYLGADLSEGALVLIADIDDFDNYIEKNGLGEVEIQRIRREFFNACSWIAELEYKKCLISLKSDSVIIFLTPDGKDLQKEGLRVANSLKEGLKGRFAKFTFSIGISRYYNNPEQVDKAFNEAKIALQISNRLNESDKVTSFEEVGTYKLLSNLLDNNPDELKAFYKETIGLLDSYDRKYQTELVKTLDCFFSCNENIVETAKKLFAHRHTVRYRLERISDLTGLSIFRSDDKEKLALGLKISRLFH